MNSLKKIMMVALIMLAITQSNAQIKNAKAEVVKIYGNCGMCESKIEKAGSLKNIAQVDWNKETKMATLSYDANKTNPEEILKRIALAGYDSDTFLAPDKAYSSLDDCCKYDRIAKVTVKAEPKTEMAGMAVSKPSSAAESQETNELQPVFEDYFSLKEALIKGDGKLAAAKSQELLAAITAVKMEALKMDVHMVWMKVLNGLTTDAKSISTTKDIKKQRESFKSLSKSTYELIKVSKLSEPVYYEYCPMANANWLSKESAIKNPYYGSQMLSCGKVVETIK
jgi:copper chaperone CopZ